MSEYTSQLTILGHFPKIFSMIHMPPKPIANAGCDTALILCKKLTFQINICPPPHPQPLAVNYRAALSLFHR